jgi:hypothetical protein
MKIAVIARCKNEIENLEKWMINKKFCDLFFITDNESTDGSFKFLSEKSNVYVTSVNGFDEGRDFQILLKMAKKHKVDWVFKFDCDEFVGEYFEEQLKYVVNETDYDCIRLRKIGKHYTMPHQKCFLTREYHNGGVYGVRLSPRIEIRDKKIHVGSFYFYKKSIILDSLVSHYWIKSEEDAKARAETYSKADVNKNYGVKNKVPINKFVDIEVAKTQKFKKFEDYDAPFLFKKNDSLSLTKPKFKKAYIKMLLKFKDLFFKV